MTEQVKVPHERSRASKSTSEKVRGSYQDGPCKKRFYKIQEAVDYSGHSRSTLYEAHKRGELIFTKFGGATRIEKNDLDAYLDSTGVKVEVAA